MRIQLRLRQNVLTTATGLAVVLGAPLALGSPLAEGTSPESKPAEQTIAEPQAKEHGSVEPAEGLYGEVTPRPRQLGLMFDFGSLDGAMLSLVYRPLPWLRTYGGSGTNGAAAGVRLGASIAPLHQKNWALNLDGGHFFRGDVNGIFSAVAGANYIPSQALEHFDYDFVDLQAGWEAESDGLMFFVRGGVGFVWSQIPPEGLAHLRHVSSLVAADGSVQAFLPSLRVGLIGFF